MITCSVCQAENDQYVTICKQCGGYLQNRVPNLDLFDVLWKIIENPKNAFQLIVRSEHKNYAVFLYTLSGIALSFAGLWHFKLGDRFENILLIIFLAILIGIPMGLVLSPIASSLHWMISKILGCKTSFRNSLGITSYSLTPVVLSLFFVLPVELLTFGMYLFTFNPPPITVKPMPYVILIGFDGLLTLWSWVLLIIGTKVGNQTSWWKSVTISALVYGIILGGLLSVGEYTISRF
ncbi:MAG: YIP1 family protein [Ignavibacteriae bacterium]|nr:MAG: YIP1 family protein [Ignavibacteriota bacterium]